MSSMTFARAELRVKYCIHLFVCISGFGKSVAYLHTLLSIHWCICQAIELPHLSVKRELSHYTKDLCS